MDVLAQINWEGIGVCLSMILATGLTGVMVRDKAKAKRQRANDINDRDTTALMLKDDCNQRHESLDRLLTERHKGLETRIDDLRTTVEGGFDRIQKSLDART